MQLFSPWELFKGVLARMLLTLAEKLEGEKRYDIQCRGARMPEESLAILQKGEKVFTKQQMKDLGKTYTISSIDTKAFLEALSKDPNLISTIKRLK